MLTRLQSLLMSLRRVLQFALLVPALLGPLVLVALLLGPPLVIGEGQFEHLVHAIEAFNFRWALLGLVFFGSALPAVLLVVWRRSQTARIELDALRDRVLSQLEGRSIPVTVDISERIPVEFDEALDVPVALTTEVGFDHDVEIEADIPIRTELPLDTTVQTSVFGIGSISIPIKATLPLDFNVPISGKLRIRVEGIPIDINEHVRIQLPPIEVPLTCQLATRIDILKNIESVGLLGERADDAHVSKK